MFKQGFSFEFSMALRYLRAKRKQGGISVVGFLSVAGVSVGVMALVVVIAVMSGAKKDLSQRILGMEPSIILYSKTGSFSDYSSLCKKIKENKKVKEALPHLSDKVMLRSRWGLNGTIIRGVDTDARVNVIRGLTAENLKSLLNNGSNDNSIILGVGVAASLGVSEGDSLYALTSNLMVSPVGMHPSMIELHVAGVFKSGLYEYDSAIGYMKLKGVQSILGMKDEVTGIGVYTDDLYAAEEIADELLSLLDNRFTASTWMKRNEALFEALKVEKTAMFIILSFIILVAAFNIASSLIMLVMEKTREISIMKTMGATKKSIKRIFVIQGTIIGCIGTSIGITGGIGLSLILNRYKFIKLPDAYPFASLPVDLQVLDIAAIAVSAIVICFFSTLYPASQAANLDPVEGIRYGD